MTIWRKILATALLLALGTTAWGQSRGGTLADQLNDLRQQQRQVERDISQYETSIRLLDASRGTTGDTDSTLETLQLQLKQSQAMLSSLNAKEQQVQQQLNPGLTPLQAGTGTAAAKDPEALDVARLKQLLIEYQASEAEAEARAAANSEDTPVSSGRGDADYAADRVRLSGSEGLAALMAIDARMADDSTSSQYRELDIIFHIEVRRDAKLVSSSSFSLKALGKAQYVGKVRLEGGSATVNVRKDSWLADLSPVDPSDYLVILNMHDTEKPELHVISVAELKATGVSELPVWVPYIGTLAAAPAQS